MDGKRLDYIIKTAGAALKDMKTGPGCPGDDMLLNYAYGTVSRTEHREIAKHIGGCLRCRFEAMRIEADRAAWEASLDEAPDISLSSALGREGLARIRETEAYKTMPGPTRPRQRFSSLPERYQAYIKEGLESFRAALEAIRETLSWTPGAMVAQEEQASYGASPSPPKSTHGKPLPAIPLPEAGELPYLTLILVRLELKEVVLLLKNEKIGEKRYIHPEIGKNDIGRNRLYITLTPAPIEIERTEADITPDRFVEIIAQAEAMSGHVEVMEMEIRD